MTLRPLPSEAELFDHHDLVSELLHFIHDVFGFARPHGAIIQNWIDGMKTPANVLGIDIGSVSLALAEINPVGKLVGTFYDFHHGYADDCLKRALGQFDLSRIVGISATTSTPATVKVSHRYDNRVAAMAAVRHFYSRVRSIVIIGAEKFGLIQLDRQGNYRTFRANTGCAAGTGSFLDQQALRLKLENAAQLSVLAQTNTGAIPKIASRCAVFAKTDLAHAQQEGYLLEEICDGLCFGLAKNVVDVLFSTKKYLEPPIGSCVRVSRCSKVPFAGVAPKKPPWPRSSNGLKASSNRMGTDHASGRRSRYSVICMCATTN
jgi:hypothetical protein